MLHHIVVELLRDFNSNFWHLYSSILTPIISEEYIKVSKKVVDLIIDISPPPEKQTLYFCIQILLILSGDCMLWEVRIAYKPGVQDTEGESTLKGLQTLGFKKVREVKTAKVYEIKGEYTREDVEEMCKRLLANPVSQDYTIEEIKESE
jgi:phosphoribosylformylglycinamidine synthase